MLDTAAVTEMDQLNLRMLQIELLRINVLVEHAVRCLQLAGQDFNDQFRGLHISDEEALALAKSPPKSSWGTENPLSSEEAREYEASLKGINIQRNQIFEQAEMQSQRLRLSLLKEIFKLSAFEMDAFLICLAPMLDLRYERLYGFLQDDVTHKLPGVELILNLLLPPGMERLQHLESFRDHAPLIRYNLLEKVESGTLGAFSILKQDLLVPSEIVSWILGDYSPNKKLSNVLHLLQPEPDSEEFLLQQDSSQPNYVAIEAAQAVLALYGPDEIRMLDAARQVAAQLRKPLLVADLSAAQSVESFSHPAVLRLIFRDALLEDALPCFMGWDYFLSEDGVLPEDVFSELDSFAKMTLLCSSSLWRVENGRLSKDRPLLWWPFTLPSAAERSMIWQQSLAGANEVSIRDFDLLAGQFTLTTRQIQNAAWTAKNTAFQAGRPVHAEDLFEAARLHSSHHLDQLAVKIESRYRWEDIVLPDEEMSVLREVVTTVRGRPLVLETWGVGEKLVASTGISALFAGPPGTGKTLAAQVIAAELGMDIYKVDLSTVVSKYIGETEKNLERIFSQARNSNAILFFDEADAIFGKRSEVKDAHDRYANIEVGYLLQRMESYDGVVILATNLRANLDEAFTRRLQFVVDFPFPDEMQRLEIWQVLFPPGVPREEDINFELLAKRFKLAGGSIRNAIVSSAFLAASEAVPVGTRHLMHGVRRELQKMGRLINEQDLKIEG